MKTAKFQWLQVMRGIAAIWVVVYHANNLNGVFLRPLARIPFIENGVLGVDFFFILSGFIIASSSHSLIERGEGLKDYALARLTRIYVPYFPIGVGIFMLYAALPSVSAADRQVGLLSTLTLLPTDLPPALNVAWTLVHEVIFYAIFSLIFISRRLLWSTLLCWGLLIVARLFTGGDMGSFESYFLSPQNLDFLLGVAIFCVDRDRMTARASVLAAGAGLVVVLTAAICDDPNRVAVSLGFGLLVTAAASPSGAGSRAWRLPLSLGSASYAIYLTHNPVLSILVRAIRIVDPAINSWLVVLAMSATAVSIGIAYWWYFELRALRAARALLELGRSSPPIPAAPLAG